MRGLPNDGALARAIDPKWLGRGWTINTELAAVLCELVDTSNRLYMSAHVKKGTRLPKPIFIRRPDDNDRKKKATPGQTREWMKRKGIPIRKIRRSKKGTT